MTRIFTVAAIPFLIILACTLTTISPVDTSQSPVGATETAEVPSLPRWEGIRAGSLRCFAGWYRRGGLLRVGFPRPYGY